jgi:glycosyltransferase involved in cell wall biosynthesis
VIRTLLFYTQTLMTLRANPASVLVQRAAGIHTPLVAVIARLLGCRFVYASAGVVDFDSRSPARRRWIAWAFGVGVRLADRIVVQTAEQARLCQDRFERDPVVIASIAEPAPQQSCRPDLFLWIGAPTDHKQPLAFVELARAVPEARFVMVVGEARPYERAAGEADLAKAAAGLANITLLPSRPRTELASLLDRAVAVVSTSRSEGMPNVFLEAWARGAPTLALNHDPDGVIERERLGGCAHGSPARLAELARELWEQRDHRAELAARCRRYVGEEHAPEHVADRWEAALALRGATHAG